MILVVLENQRGKIHSFSKEAITAGQKFAKQFCRNANQKIEFLDW